MSLRNIASFKNNLSKCKKRKKELAAFLQKDLPIFWIIGPAGCGKSTLAEMIKKSSKFHLIDVKLLIKDDKLKWNKTAKTNESEEITLKAMLNMLKTELIRTSSNAIGYIIDGFPTNLHEAKLFEHHICNVKVIFYLTLVLDGLLARKVTQVGNYNVNQERVQYARAQSNMKTIFRRYGQRVIRLHSNYPPEATCAKLIEILEDYWGFKFLRLYNKHLTM